MATFNLFIKLLVGRKREEIRKPGKLTYIANQLVMQTSVAKNIDEYIATFPGELRERLEKVRAIIHKAAPLAKETISYAIPTFTLEGILVHFAGYKNHIGFYPGVAAINSFKKELATYNTSKGTVQLPHDRALPIGLISQIVKFRVKLNKEKALAKQAKRKKT